MKRLVIIGHSIRQEKIIISDGKKLKIAFDRLKGESHNEDPYIWAPRFIYTFCHGNISLKKEYINSKDSIYYVFVARKKGDSELFIIDTVIKQDFTINWPQKGTRTTNSIKRSLMEAFINHGIKLSNVEVQDIIDHHFPKIENDNKILSEHDRKILFSAVGTKDSFLPLEKSESNNYYGSVILPRDYSEKVKSLITAKGNHAFYPITDGDNRLQDKLLKDYGQLKSYIFDNIICNDNIIKVYAENLSRSGIK